MKITILTLGSRGDVQPYIAIGLGLQTSGHKVTIATHAMFEAFIQSVGLKFSAIRTSSKQVLEAEAKRLALEGGTSPIRSFRNLARAFEPILQRGAADCWTACQEAEAIIYSDTGALLGPSIAEALDVPEMALLLRPRSPTQVFPDYTVTHRNLGGILNRLTYFLPALTLWLPLRYTVNEWRQDQLGLPPIRLRYPVRERKERLLTIYGFSSYVVPRPPDWGDHIQIAGFWFLDSSTDWHPPVALLDFLASGPPPVYVGFGSTIIQRPDKIKMMVLEALSRTRQRGLISTGWGGLTQAGLPDHVLSIESAPHDWLFPRMAAVVHHAGPGTTAAGLRAGIPCVVIPFLADQPFWAQRVADLGVGPEPIPQARLSVECLAAAITTAVTDKMMQERAASLGERILVEDGVGKAVAMINQYLASQESIG